LSRPQLLLMSGRGGRASPSPAIAFAPPG